MNIGFLNNSYNIQTNKVNNKNTFSPTKNISASDDIFIKNSDTINFKGTSKKFEQTYNPCREEITNYILNEKSPDKKGLEKIIQKYSPTTTVDDMKNLKDNFPTKDLTGAYTKQPIAVMQGYNGLQMQVLPKTMYIRTALLTGNKNERLKLLQDVAHETTHVIQDDASDREKPTDVLNPFLQGKAPTPNVLATLQYTPVAFQATEREMLGSLISSFDSINKYGLPEPINAKNGLKNETDRIYKKLSGKDTKTYAKCVLQGTMMNLRQSGIPIDNATFLKYVSYKAKAESEAYQNGCSTVKKEMNIEKDTNLDLVPIMYRELDKASQELLKTTR